MYRKGTEALSVLLRKHINRGNLLLVNALTNEGVEFVIIGGVALAYHGLREVHDVDDLDLLLEPNNKTIEGVISALQTLALDTSNLSSTIKPRTKLPLKDCPYYAELIFAEEIERAPEIISGCILVSLDSTTLRLASVDHLRTMKERVVKIFHEELKTLEQDKDAHLEKLKKHKRDLEALNDHSE
jgi:hypothetical protein